MRVIATFFAISLMASATGFAQTDGAVLSQKQVEDAIRRGEGNNVPSGRVTEKSQWSWGSTHIATFSTPSMRVAAAARDASKHYGALTVADVMRTPTMIEPELHVYAWSKGDANVSTIVITPKKGSEANKRVAAIQPIRFEPIPQQWQDLFGVSLLGTPNESVGFMAVFPMSALSKNNEVHVVYDRNVRIGFNAYGGARCDDCSGSFDLKGVR